MIEDIEDSKTAFKENVTKNDVTKMHIESISKSIDNLRNNGDEQLQASFKFYDSTMGSLNATKAADELKDDDDLTKLAPGDLAIIEKVSELSKAMMNPNLSLEDQKNNAATLSHLELMSKGMNQGSIASNQINDTLSLMRKESNKGTSALKDTQKIVGDKMMSGLGFLTAGLLNNPLLSGVFDTAKQLWDAKKVREQAARDAELTQYTEDAGVFAKQNAESSVQIFKMAENANKLSKEQTDEIVAEIRLGNEESKNSADSIASISGNTSSSDRDDILDDELAREASREDDDDGGDAKDTAKKDDKKMSLFDKIKDIAIKFLTKAILVVLAVGVNMLGGWENIKKTIMQTWTDIKTFFTENSIADIFKKGLDAYIGMLKDVFGVVFDLIENLPFMKGRMAGLRKTFGMGPGAQEKEEQAKSAEKMFEKALSQKGLTEKERDSIKQQASKAKESIADGKGYQAYYKNYKDKSDTPKSKLNDVVDNAKKDFQQKALHESVVESKETKNAWEAIDNLNAPKRATLQSEAIKENSKKTETKEVGATNNMAVSNNSVNNSMAMVAPAPAATSNKMVGAYNHYD
jgi:hypothetical protein